MTMKAWLLTGIGRMEMREVLTPKISRPDQVRIRIRAVGVCGSDVHYFREGRIGDQVIEYPFIIGHECAGMVEEVGAEVSDLKPGDRVAVEPAVSCLACDQCRTGRHHTCRRLAFLGCPGQLSGCLAEYIVMPRRNLHPVPDEMRFEEAVLAEPLSIGIYALKKADLPPSSRIGVLGVGPIGVCVLAAFRPAGAERAFVTDKLDYRLAFALRQGADWAGNSDREDIVSEILAREPEGLDAVFECCGEQQALDQAVKLLKPGGTLVIVGIPSEDMVSFPIHEIRRKEIAIKNIRRQLKCLDQAVDMIKDQKSIFRPMITHQVDFLDAPTAFQITAEYRDEVIKAVITI